MYLERLTLTDWKLYGGEQTLEFPTPTRRKNVVLIGAKNGFGKTSLLEALAFGLYGKEGLDLVARADSHGDEDRRHRSYARFIEGAFNETASAGGRSTMRVAITFVDPDDGTRFEVRRTWSFKNDRRLHEETVELFVNGKAKAPGRAEANPEDFYRSWVQQATMPSHLARFFLFDGERVQELAQQNMAEQVRLGIEGFLGVRLLRELAHDLTVYADRKRAEVKVGDDTKLEELGAELERLQHQREELLRRHDAATKEVKGLDTERERLAGASMALGGGAVSDISVLHQDRARWERSWQDGIDRLRALLGGDFALAMVGDRLRKQTVDRVEAEQKLAQREAGIQASRGRSDRFVDLMLAAEPAFDPLLSESQQVAIRLKAAQAWDAFWNPPTDGSAPEYRHTSLADTDRLKVVETLRRVQGIGRDAVYELLNQIEDSAAKKRAIDTELNASRSIEDTLKEHILRYEEVSRKHAEAVAAEREVARLRAGVEADLQRVRADFERQSANHRAAAPELAKIDLARRTSAMIDPFIEEAVGGCVAEVADGMTLAFKEMAHKRYLDRIEIDEGCNVRLLSRSGADLREQQLSAGENQVFASSLISALARAAEIRFPLVIDTPLARLDNDHRRNVLKHFTENVSDQVVLLSQDAEVTGELYELVKPRVVATFLIENESRPGSKTGKARIVPGKYFDV